MQFRCSALKVTFLIPNPEDLFELAVLSMWLDRALHFLGEFFFSFSWHYSLMFSLSPFTSMMICSLSSSSLFNYYFSSSSILSLILFLLHLNSLASSQIPLTSTNTYILKILKEVSPSQWLILSYKLVIQSVVYISFWPGPPLYSPYLNKWLL